ncbi:thiamine pyrophosphate-binding protein [Siccirubricoccus deserti]
MAESTYNVGDLVAEFLARIGVTTCFGIVSVHNIPMLDGIGRRNAIRYVMARNEMGGAHMADAYARVSGHLGVMFSSTGPGAANAVAGLVEAHSPARRCCTSPARRRPSSSTATWARCMTCRARPRCWPRSPSRPSGCARRMRRSAC